MAYESCQSEPKAPRTPSCSNGSPYNCHDRTLGPQNKENIPKTHSWPTPRPQGDGDLTFHTYQGRSPSQRSLLGVPLQQGRSFPMSPQSKPFTLARVVSSDNEGEVAPEDVLHSSKEDEMPKIFLTDKPGASTPNSLSRRTAADCPHRPRKA